jgi:hypothetical protein
VEIDPSSNETKQGYPSPVSSPATLAGAHAWPPPLQATTWPPRETADNVDSRRHGARRLPAPSRPNLTSTGKCNAMFSALATPMRIVSSQNAQRDPLGHTAHHGSRPTRARARSAAGRVCSSWCSSARRVLIHSSPDSPDALVSLPCFPIPSSQKNFLICGRFCAVVLLSIAIFLYSTGRVNFERILLGRTIHPCQYNGFDILACP